MPHRPTPDRSCFWRALACLLTFVSGALTGFAESAARRAFDVPAQRAESALKLFSDQSGQGLIMNPKSVGDIRTNAVKGEFTPQEALEKLLAGTGLIATRDEKSAAYLVH